MDKWLLSQNSIDFQGGKIILELLKKDPEILQDNLNTK